MEVLQSSVYAIAFGLCLFTAMIVRLPRSAVPIRFFLAFLIIHALGFVFEWLMIHPTMPFTMLWLFAVMTLSLLVSPCAWAFAQDLNNEKLDLSVKSLLPHIAVIIVGVLLLVPLFSTLFTDGPFKSMRLPGAAQHSVIHVAMLLMAAVFVLQSAYYIRQCVNSLAQRAEQNKGLFTQISDIGSNTLRILILAVMANCLIASLRVLYCWALDEGPMLNVLFAILQMACLVYVAQAVLRQTISPNAGLEKERKELFSDNEQPLKYQNSGLSEERRQKVLARLEQLLKEQKVYRDNELNLSLLCERLNESSQVLSQVINQSHYQNFYQMINQHRIAEAKTLLVTGSDLSILEIAYQVGYNSKSTFNSAFKKFVDCSPTEFRRRSVRSPSSHGLPV